MFKRILISMVLAGIGGPVCFAQEPDHPESTAVVTVHVTNKTANGTDVTGDTVIVRVFHHNQLLDTIQGKVDDTGKAVFQNVTTGEHFVAVASVMHNEMKFQSRAFALDQGRKTAATFVHVFEHTTETAGLSIETHHFILEVREQQLVVTEYMQIKNDSNMAISSDRKDERDRPVVLEVMLPEGFKNIQYNEYFEKQAVVVTEHGFYDTMAIPPGSHRAVFIYTMDISSDTMNIAKELSLPTSEFMLFTQLATTKLQGMGPAEGQLIAANGKPMQYYKRINLDKAREITFNITGFNVSASGTASWPILAMVVGTILILAIIRAAGQKTDMESSNNL